MQTKTGAFLSMGRIPQFIGHAAVAAGLLAGGASLLNAGGAMANPFPPAPCPQGPVGPDVVSIACTAPPSTGFGNVDLTYSGIIGGKPTYQVDTDFDGNTGGPLTGNLAGPYSGVFNYSITNAHKFDFVGLSQNIIVPSSGATVTKDVFTVDPLVNPLAVPILTLNGTDTFNTGQAIAPTQTLYIRDTYTGLPTAALDNYINTYQTPGPLPILGAGAAFGFSRKLRGRIKAARTA